MSPRRVVSSAVILLLLAVVPAVDGQTSNAPETVVVHSGQLTLRGLLWRPQGRGPFPAVVLNHGSGRTREELQKLGPYEEQASLLGPVFARHGYVFLYLFRRGVGLSSDQGENAVDVMNRESAEHGQEARNALQIKLLESREMDDALAGLAFLREMRDVNSSKLAVIGDSFGSSLTLLEAAREPKLQAVVVFSSAGYSWDRSPELRARLLDAVGRIKAPIFFIHAANDYTTSPGNALDARCQELGKPHRLKIYPPIGKTAAEGHGFLYRGVSIWEPDVFAFLDEYMRK